ncbi:MAG: gamma-glutamyltransferase [Planctomycetota bacterium]|nr:gamma-glutamyltransferase [Planctomycetota bacterium]
MTALTRALSSLAAACALAGLGGAGASAQVSPLGPGAGVYEKACVAADHALASAAGADILRAGGNAVDAAVATSFALSVVRPYSCGIGGGGFMVIRLKDHPRVGPVTVAIDYREAGPRAVRADSFENDPDPDASTHGGKAVCVPGTVAGLLHALERYGTLDREAVLAPAIRLAEEGFTADAHYVENAREDALVLPWFRKDPARAARFAFVWERYLLKGEVQVGDRIHVPEQGEALRRIARDGRAGFYEGPVASAMVACVQKDNGFLTLEDLASYRVREFEPLRTRFRGLEVLGMPPPSSGGIVLAQVLGMLEHRRADLDALVAADGHNSAAYIHLIAESSKHAFADRARWVADPDFARVPLAGLLAPSYLRARADAFDPARTLPHESYGSATPPPDDAGTSHFCVIDEHGNAVACTETVNLIFGSMLVAEPFGVLLNCEMDDFQTRTGALNAFQLAHAEGNRPAPGKRPLSSMTPTLAFDAAPDGSLGDLRFAGGGAGGPRIISGTLQAALNAIVWDMNAHDALRAPRFHHQWTPDRLDLEPALHRSPAAAGLGELGHSLGTRKAIGNVQIVKRSPRGWEAASDPRKGGAPDGY